MAIIATREIFGDVQRCLRTNAGIDHLRVIEKKSNEFREWTLPDGGHGFLVDERQMWMLHPLAVDSQVREYLFGLRVLFFNASGKNNFLNSASILVAVRRRTATAELRPIVRAELDTNGAPHAQPHWHILCNQSETNPFEADDLTHLFSKGARIHWAMCAKWPEHGSNPAAHSLGFDQAQFLVNWVGGCIAYIRHQLTFVEAMLPSTQNFFATPDPS